MPAASDLFVDTSSWVALVDSADAHHAECAAIIAGAIRQKRSLVTSNHVLAEVVSLITTRRVRISHAQMVAFVGGIRTDQTVRMVHVDPGIDTAAWQLVASRPDKQWSQVDASSFILMQQLGLTEALTIDAHFAQAGFIRMPTP